MTINMENTIKRAADGKVTINGVIYDSNIGKRISVSNPDTGNRIASIQIGETTYYPVGVVKEKKVKEKMATKA